MMKKYYFLVCLMAAPVWADGEIFIPGVVPTPDYSSIAYAEKMAAANPTRYSTSYSPEAYAQMQAANKKAEEAAKKQYCIAMNIKCD